MKQKLTQKRVLFPLLTLLSLSLVLMLCLVGCRTTAYEVYVNGKQVCVVKDAGEFQNKLHKVCQEQAKATGHPVNVKDELKFKRVLVNEKAILADAQVAKIIARELKLVTTGAAIVVDGKPVVVVSSESKAKEVLERLKKGYTGCESGEKLVSAEFEQKVEINQKTVSTDKIVSPDQALQILQTGTDSPTIYEVKEGDSLWLIARRHDTHVVDIVAANKLKSERLQLGQKLAISTTSPYVDVVTVVEGTREEKIPYKTRVEVDRKSSSVKVKQAGKEGQKQVTYRLTCKNGSTVDKNILSENIIEKAVDRVIVKGERIVVASRGSGRSSGTLSWPIYGRITSGYGSRGGSHKGIDIGAKTGTAIRAADGGTVRFAGWSGGYGKMVEIAHGNGVVTRYAHCSKLLVSKGSKVSKGQVIAHVGSTGRSTGPHLHFEVINGGRHNNPLGYLK